MAGYHVTLARPARLILGDRSSMILAFDASIDDDRQISGLLSFTTSAVYASKPDGSPTQMKIKTSLHVNAEHIVSMWPLPSKTTG